MKNNGCPECGCHKVINVNVVGEGFRNCKFCMQDWWADVEYEYHINAQQDNIVAEKSTDNSEMDAIALFEEGVEILTEFVDDDDCRLDHHGYCQTHGWFDNSECINKQTKRYIEKLNAVIAQRHH